MRVKEQRRLHMQRRAVLTMLKMITHESNVCMQQWKTEETARNVIRDEVERGIQ